MKQLKKILTLKQIFGYQLSQYFISTKKAAQVILELYEGCSESKFSV